METIGKLESRNAREEAVIRALRRAYAESVHGRFLGASVSCAGEPTRSAAVASRRSARGGASPIPVTNASGLALDARRGKGRFLLQRC